MLSHFDCGLPIISRREHTSIGRKKNMQHVKNGNNLGVIFVCLAICRRCGSLTPIGTVVDAAFFIIYRDLFNCSHVELLCHNVDCTRACIVVAGAIPSSLQC